MSDDTTHSKDSFGLDDESLPLRVIRRQRAPTGPGNPEAGRPTRRSVLQAVAGLTVGGLAAGGATVGSVAAGSGDDSGAVPTPTVSGPITGGVRTGQPQTAFLEDSRDYGYIEDEYLISGTARALGPSLLGVADAEDSREYTTRMLVYRPLDPDRFNGTLVVNWPNVTSQLDVPYAFINTFEYLFREGYAVAIPSVQRQGTTGSPLALRNWDPVRYRAVTHPGDEYSYDMFSQAIKACLADPDPHPLVGLDPDTVLAMGISQSAGFLLTYINQVQENHGLVDGFMPQHSGSVPSSPAGIRDDLVPILWMNSESEADSTPPDDHGEFTFWEVAGSSHVNNWDNRWWFWMNVRDHGNAGGAVDVDDVPDLPDLTGASAGWNPETAGEYGANGGLGCPNNLFPQRFTYRAGLHHLNERVTNGTAIPTAPHIERVDGDAKTDADGNAIGGVRLPPLEVPVATYAARNCGPLFGETQQFDQATLNDRYASHDDYVAQMTAATDVAVANGWLLPTDAEELLERARTSPIPEASGDDPI